jgi:uncharacterized membrane protein HdeD (DUF308 family)
MGVNEQDLQKLESMWARTWWTLLILGAGAIVLGLFSVLFPQFTATLPVRILAILIGLDGVYKLGTAVLRRGYNWINRALTGAAEICIAILVFYFSYNLTTAVFTIALYVLGFIFFTWGVFTVLAALRRRFQFTRLLVGAAQIGIGVLMFAINNQLADTLGWVVGAFFAGIGLLLIFAGWWLRQVGRRIKPQVLGSTVEGVVIHADGETYYEGHEEKTVILIPSETESDD